MWGGEYVRGKKCIISHTHNFCWLNPWLILSRLYVLLAFQTPLTENSHAEAAEREHSNKASDDRTKRYPPFRVNHLIYIYIYHHRSVQGVYTDGQTSSSILLYEHKPTFNSLAASCTDVIGGGGGGGCDVVYSTATETTCSRTWNQSQSFQEWDLTRYAAMHKYE